MRTYNKTAPSDTKKSDEKDREELDVEQEEEDIGATPLLPKELKRNILLNCVTSIKTMLLTIVAGMTIGFLVVTAIWISSFFSLTNTLAKEQHDTVFQGMKSFIEQKMILMKNAGDQSISLVDNNMLDLTDFNAVRFAQFAAFKRIYKAFEATVYSTISPNPSLNPYNMPSIIGYVATSTRKEPPTMFYNWYGVTGNTTLMRSIVDEENGSFLKTDVITPFYRANEALGRSLKSSESGWISPYVFNPCVANCYIFVGYFAPSWKNGEMQAYSSILYNAATMSKFLAQLTKKGGLTVIIGRSSGKVLGLSKLDSLTMQIPKTNNSRLIDVGEIPSNLVNATFNALKSKFGSSYTGLMNNSTTSNWHVESLTIPFKGGKLLINAAHFSLLDWVMVYTVPSSVFIDPAIPGASIAIAVSLAIMILSIFLSAVIALLITSPLGKLISEISKVKSMELDTIKTNTKNLALVSELASIQFNFYVMVSRLRLYRSFLPSHILANLEDNSGDHMVLNGQEHETDSFIDSRESRSSLSTAQTKNAELSRFSLGLECKDVTTLYFRIANRKEVLDAFALSDFVALHSRLCSVVTRAAARFKGEMQECKHNRFSIHWNTASKVSDPVRLALTCALHLKRETSKKVSQRTIFSDVKQVFPRYSIAVVSGPTYIGNLGNKAKKVYNIFGESIELCETLELLNEEYNTTIVSNCANPHVVTRKVDEITYPSGKSVPIYEVVEESKSKRSDEWMYEMQEQEKSNRFQFYNDAYKLFEQGLIEEASKTLNKYLERAHSSHNVHSPMHGSNSRSDPVAHYLSTRLEKMRGIGAKGYRRVLSNPPQTTVHFSS